MKRKDAPFPYEEYFCYDPIFHEKEGRYYVFMIHKVSSIHTTISNARFIYETHHKIKLSSEQFVDHKDDVKSNDSIDNLQVLSRIENNKKSLIHNDIMKGFVELCCPNCSIVFIREKRQTYISKKGKFTACSRICSGTIRQKLQAGIEVDLSKNFVREFKERAVTSVG